MAQQLTHREHKRLNHNKQIVLLTDGVSSPANIGSLFRLADAFGLQQLIFGNETLDLQSGRLKKTARSTERLTPATTSTDILQSLKQLRSSGYTCVGLELSSNSINLNEWKDASQKIAFVIGGEKNGLSPEVLSFVDIVVSIPMFGANSSMNVTHAAAIALYEITKPNAG